MSSPQAESDTQDPFSRCLVAIVQRYYLIKGAIRFSSCHCRRREQRDGAVSAASIVSQTPGSLLPLNLWSSDWIQRTTRVLVLLTCDQRRHSDQMLVLLAFMWKRLGMGLRAFLLLASKFWNFVLYIFRKQVRTVRVFHSVPLTHSSVTLTQVIQYQAVKYDVLPLSPLSRHRLSE